MAYRPRRLLLAAIALTLTATATACGGDGKPKAGSTPSGTPAVTGTPSASGSASASASASAGTKPGSGTSGAPSGSASAATGGKPGASTAPGSKPTTGSSNQLFLTLRLAQLCVVPGQEQSAAIRTVPNADFLIDTVYSDKKEGTVHGGFKRDKADKDGKYTYTWTVLPGTPPGDAWTIIRAAKDGKRGQAVKRFRVAAIC